MPLDVAMNYADDTLRWTMESGVPDDAKLEWYRVRDIATRTKMMELMRQPPYLHAAEALRVALDFMRNEWRPSKVIMQASEISGGGHDRRRSRPRDSRGSEADKVRSGTVSTAKGGLQLCPDFNAGRCRDEKRCPRRQAHLCNHRVSNGKACAQKHQRCLNH